ncbi:MAG TPA: Hint domain-containing protein, partial [Polyangia bacterium]|nr:Hint domain-containing protein [Polyangia bacterium]
MRVRGSLRRIRGVSAIEYGVVLVLVAMSIIIGYRTFGKRVRCAMATAGNKLADSGAADECATPPTVAQNDPGSGSGGCQGAACLMPGNCFVAGTLVVTDEGEQPIETITVGEQVLARDEAGALAWEPVVRTFARSTDALVRLTLASHDNDNDT